MKTKFLFLTIMIISSLQSIAQLNSNITWYAFGAYACAPASATVNADLNYTLYSNNSTYSSSTYFLYRITGYMPNANGATSQSFTFTVKDYKQGSFTFSVNRGNNLPSSCVVTLEGSNNSGSNWTTLSSYTCNSPQTGIRNTLSSADFSINGVGSTASLPGTILRCSSGNTLNLEFSNEVVTTASNCTYKIEKGNYVASVFAPISATSANTFTSATLPALPASIDLLSSQFSSLRLSEWSGFVRVTVSMIGACNVLTNEQKIYNIDGNIEFTQKPTSGCLNTQVIQRYTDINFTGNSNGVFSSAPCLQGWMGATTCGINLSSSLTGITKSQVIVDRINTSGSIITPNIYNVTNFNGMLASVDFNNHLQFGPVNTAPPPAIGTGTYNHSINSKVNFVIANNWFSSNYNIIKNAATIFRIKVNATNSAGTCTSIGYFKIADGSPFWKKENSADWNPLEGLNTSNTNLEIIPNPANNAINFYNSEKDANLIIYDIFGKKILEKPIVVGYNNISILNISNGQYFININSTNSLSKGKFIKQ